MSTVSPLMPMGIQALLIQESSHPPKSSSELAKSFSELRNRVEKINRENQQRADDLSTLVRPAADVAIFVGTKILAHSMTKGNPVMGAADLLLGRVGLSVSDMIAGGATSLADKTISMLLDYPKEEGEKEADEILRRGLANLTEKHREELENAIREQHDNKQLVSLTTIPEVSAFLDQFKDNPRQLAVATNFLLKDFKIKKTFLASGGKYDSPSSPSRTGNIKTCAEVIDRSAKDAEKVIEEQKKQAEVMKKGLAAINKNAQLIRQEIAAGHAVGVESLAKISMLEDLAKMRMTPKEKRALIRSGKLKVEDPNEIKALEDFCATQERLEDVQKAMNNVSAAVDALSTWGVKVPPAVHTAVGVGNAAVSVFANIASGNALGAAIGAIGGMGLIFGKKRLDPSAQRHQQVMEAFDEVLKGQEALRKGQEELFKQGQAALSQLSIIESKQEMIMQGVARSMELQIELCAKELEAIEGVRKDIIQGNLELMRSLGVIIQGQISIYEMSLELRKEVQTIRTSLADIYLELSKQLAIIHEDVLHVMLLQVEDLGREISAWRNLGSSLISSNMWNILGNRFVDYTALVGWVETNHVTINTAYGMYNTIIPQSSSSTGETLHPLLRWRTHVRETSIHEGSRIGGLRLTVYQPLIDWFDQLQDPQKWTRLAYPVRNFSDFYDREKFLSSLPLAHDLLKRKQLMNELLYPPYLSQLTHFFPLLIQLRAVMQGERVISRENLLNPHFRLSNEPTLLLNRFYHLFDLAIAQQALIAGDVVIPYYWNRLFNNPIESTVSEGDQRFLMNILYAKEAIVTDSMSEELKRYESQPDEALSDEKERLFDQFHLPYSNQLLAENLIRYIIYRYIERSSLDYEKAFASFSPFMLEHILPGWTCIYSQKRGAWLGLMKMKGGRNYLSFVLPSAYSVQKKEIAYPEEMLQLINAQCVLGMAIREEELGHDQEFRSILMSLL